MNLNFRRLLTRVASLVLCAVVLGAGARAALAQQQQAPLTNAEFLALVRQLPKRPDLKEQLIAEQDFASRKATYDSAVASLHEA